MINRKSTLKYYFTVEGETEGWYLKWLQDKINESPDAANKVSFNWQMGDYREILMDCELI